MSKRKKKDRTPRSFRGNPDYKAEFERAVTALINEKIADRAERMAHIQALTDEYVRAVGERPDGRQLERLANEILREELSNKDKYKVARMEYPILSEIQIYRRRGAELPLHAAEDYGLDGRNYAKPKRRKRSKKENAFLDRAVKARNAERRRKHREAMRASEVVVKRIENITKEVSQ